jgi:predicted P-loop ATPase
LETVFKRKEVAQVKAFMTTKIDLLRPPYGRSIEALKRSSVFVGTTNEREFLADSTGNRRFWVIPASKPLDTKLLEQERDRIWAAAITLHGQGHTWWLNDSDEILMEQQREDYRTRDPWYDIIAKYVEVLDETTTEHLLEQVIKVDRCRIGKGEQRRIGAILRELGWESKSVRRTGGVARLWIKQ